MPGQLKQPAIIILSMTIYLISMPFIHYPLITLLKPLPIFLLILLSHQSIEKSKARTLLTTALLFSMLGDIVLTLPFNSVLPLGILFFLMAHCAYTSLFLLDAQFKIRRITVFLPLAILIVFGFFSIWPFLGTMKIPVMIYTGLLSLMVFCSLQVRKSLPLITSGAILFMTSDFIFALNDFVFPYRIETNIFIMLLYYSAQFLLVQGMIACASQTAMGALIAECD